MLKVECVICGSTKRLKFVPMMAGTESKDLICGNCYMMWHDTKITDINKLREHVLSTNKRKSA